MHVYIRMRMKCFSHTSITSRFCVLSIWITPESHPHYGGWRWSLDYSMDLFANWIIESFMSRCGFVWGKGTEVGWSGVVLTSDPQSIHGNFQHFVACPCNFSPSTGSCSWREPGLLVGVRHSCSLWFEADSERGVVASPIEVRCFHAGRD